MDDRRQVGSLFKRTRIVSGKRVTDEKWTGSFIDPATSKKVQRRLFRDKAASRAELSKLIRDAERRASGLVDRFDEHRRSPLLEHVAAYFAHCAHVGQSEMHRHNKRVQLDRIIAGVRATRFADLEPNAVERVLGELRLAGKSARTVNQHRATVISFLNWCVKSGRVESNPLLSLARLNEQKDRRRERRALSQDDFERLLEVAGARRLAYLLAGYAGLRRSELRKVRWSDADLEVGVLRIRPEVGKAGRLDTLPLHPELAAALAEARGRGSSSGTILASVPRPETVKRDLERAGIPPVDEAGRVADLHALRSFLATTLSRAGVTPQVAQRIMRHADIRVTIAHYTHLHLDDDRAAIRSLPDLGNGRRHSLEAPEVTDSVSPEMSPTRSRRTAYGGNGRREKSDRRVEDNAPGTGYSRASGRNRRGLSSADDGRPVRPNSGAHSSAG